MRITGWNPIHVLIPYETPIISEYCCADDQRPGVGSMSIPHDPIDIEVCSDGIYGTRIYASVLNSRRNLNICEICLMRLLDATIKMKEPK